MPRTSLLSTISLALACACGGSALGAQEASAVPVTAADSLLVRQLPSVRVTATQAEATREGVLALMAENRRLAIVLARQDERIEALTRRLHHLRTTVTDSVNRDIAALDAETAATRARRQALEARLAAEGYAGP